MMNSEYEEHYRAVRSQFIDAENVGYRCRKQVVDAVNDFIERVTRRCCGDSAAITEQYDYASKLWLRHQTSRP
jgi:hypothetical protein